jgi:hypothetical protein
MESRLSEHVQLAGGTATVNIMEWVGAVTYGVSLGIILNSSLTAHSPDWTSSDATCVTREGISFGFTYIFLGLLTRLWRRSRLDGSRHAQDLVGHVSGFNFSKRMECASLLLLKSGLPTQRIVLQAIMVFRMFPFIDLLPLKAIIAQSAVRERLQVTNNIRDLSTL